METKINEAKSYKSKKIHRDNILEYCKNQAMDSDEQSFSNPGSGLHEMDANPKPCRKLLIVKNINC